MSLIHIVIKLLLMLHSASCCIVLIEPVFRNSENMQLFHAPSKPRDDQNIYYFKLMNFVHE